MDDMDQSSVARAVVDDDSQEGVSPFLSSLWPFLAGLTEAVIVLDLSAHVVYANPAFDERWHRPTRAPLPAPMSTSHVPSVRLSLVDRDGRDEVVPATIRLLHDFADRPHAVLATVVNGTHPTNGNGLADLHRLIEHLSQELHALAPKQVAMADAVEPELAERIAGLSGREREILYHMMGGKRVATTAQVLYLSEHTVRNYLKRIYHKLGVHSLGELRERCGTHPIPPPLAR